MMTNLLPITVLLPTRDAMSMLPAHVEGMRDWVGLAREVVVVDSESKDGTLEHIRGHLKHPNLKIHTRPPGLYQAWNYGVEQATSDLVYVSTVGDRITAAGLAHLHEVAARFQAPVTLSPPTLIDADGSASAKKWPVDEMVEDLGLTAPAVLSRAVSFLYAVTSIPKGTLGSSASNLYATAFLRRHPFPCDYGLSGDVALGVGRSLTDAFAVTPRSCATFVFHPKTYSKRDYEVEELSLRLTDLARAHFEREAVGSGREFADEATRLEMKRLLDCLRTKHHARQRVKTLRLGWIPWQINPAVWSARRARRRAQVEVTKLKRRLLERWRSKVEG